MRLYVELFGAISTKLPEGEGSITFPINTSPATLVDWLAVRDGEQFVVLLNGRPVQAEERIRPILRDGDRVAVFPPMEGG